MRSVSRSDIISFLEFVNAPAGINEFLLTGKERVTFAANIYFNYVYVLRRAGLESFAASALHGYDFIRRMDFRFHIITSQN